MLSGRWFDCKAFGILGSRSGNCLDIELEAGNVLNKTKLYLDGRTYSGIHDNTLLEIRVHGALRKITIYEKNWLSGFLNSCSYNGPLRYPIVDEENFEQRVKEISQYRKKYECWIE